MKTYIFETRKATAPFLRAFTNKLESQTFHVKENNSANIKIADKFFDYSWPTWNGQIPENTSAVFQGLLRNTKKVHDVCVSEGRDWYYFDQPYFFFSDYQQSITGDRWYRVCKNNTQKNFIDKTPRNKRRYDRLVEKIKLFPKALNEITLKPWQYDGKHVLVIPPSYHTAKWYGIDRHDWEKYYVSELKKYTKREIRVRHKFKNNADDITQAKKNGTDLYDDLKDCHAMVSFHSMCASQAVVHGIPSFCSEHSPAWPVSLSLKELDQIEDPLYSGEREYWLYSLVGSQFTETEMASGNAYRYINGENI